MTDIVERLRAPLGVMQCEVSSGPAPENKLERRWLLALEAADEIERLGRDYDTARDAHDRRVRELDAHCVEVARLRAEVERLRAALRQIAGMDPWSDGEQGYVDKARAALAAWPGMHPASDPPPARIILPLPQEGE